MHRFVRRPAALLATVVAAVALTAAPTAAGPPRAASPSEIERAQAAFEKLPLASTPPMGWNSWNTFGCNIDDELIRDTADAMVASGMKDAGYEYVNIDDCWMAPTRDADGNLRADPVRFPAGIKAVADYVHGLGLKLGIYSSAGTATCAGFPASLDHEMADARKFAEWGVDLLKYDNCNNQGRPAIERYTAMAEALAASGRPIVYSICEWGSNDPWLWAAKAGGHYWRTTGDINASWGSVMGILDQQVGLEAYSGPNGWNDPDMLEVGNPGLTFEESRAHMSLWALLNAPLIAGNDLRSMPASTVAMLTDPDIIAINQDWGGVQGHKIADAGDQEVWAKPMSDGGAAVVLLNRGSGGATVTTDAAALGLAAAPAYSVSDAWSDEASETRGTIRASVPSHGARTFLVEPAKPAHLAPAVSADVATDGYVDPGESFTTDVTVTNDGFTAVQGLAVSLEVPDGWTVQRGSSSPSAVVPPGASRTTSFRVTAPVQAATGSYELRATVRWTGVDGTAHTTTGIGAAAVATAPRGDRWLSDLDPLRAQVGWGDLQLDRSVDGNPITIGGTRYAKGVAAHAASEVAYYLGGVCDAFRADVGIDDEVGDRGSVTFTLLGDGKVLAETGVLTGADAAVPIEADVTGVQELELRAGTADGGNSYDHAEWAAAQVSCAGPVGTVTATPDGTVEVPAGGTVKVAATLTVAEGDVSDASLAPYAPTGWTVSGAPVTAAALAPGDTLTGTWTLTAPAGADPGTVKVPVIATFHGADDPDGPLVVDRDVVTASVLPEGWLLTREAEAAGNARGGAAVVASCGACSGGQKVGFLGNGPANDLTVTGLDVTQAGQYRLIVDYLVSGMRTLNLSVNGGPTVALQVSGSSFSTPTSASITVTLAAGTNTVRFFNDTAYAPDVDRVIVART